MEKKPKIYRVYKKSTLIVMLPDWVTQNFTAVGGGRFRMSAAKR